MKYLMAINGLLNRLAPGRGFNAYTEQVVGRSILKYGYYGGLVEINEGGNFKGELIDFWGSSDIIGKLTDTTLIFTQKYVYRSDSIQFQFEKCPTQEHHWIGTFKGEAVGSGETSCMLTLLPLDFIPKPLPKFESE